MAAPEGYMVGAFPILESWEFAVDNAAFTLVQPLLNGANTDSPPVVNSTSTDQSMSSTRTMASAVVLLLSVAWLLHL